MKKIMVALFVTMSVVLGTIGLGSREALAEPMPVKQHQAVKIDYHEIQDLVDEMTSVINDAYRFYGEVGATVQLKDVVYDGNELSCIAVTYRFGKRVSAELITCGSIDEIRADIDAWKIFMADTAYTDIWG